MPDFQDSQIEGWRGLVSDWAERWGCEGLDRRLSLVVTTRLRASAGRCNPATGELKIAAFLIGTPDALVHEVLCHEAAHVAAYELHGAGCRPHGSEWRALMRAAGYTPRTRLPASVVPGLPPRRSRPKNRWEHRCPLCHAVRVAGRRVTQWRCAACRSAGRVGELAITRMEERAPASPQRPSRIPALLLDRIGWFRHRRKRS